MKKRKLNVKNLLQMIVIVLGVVYMLWLLGSYIEVLAKQFSGEPLSPINAHLFYLNLFN